MKKIKLCIIMLVIIILILILSILLLNNNNFNNTNINISSMENNLITEEYTDENGQKVEQDEDDYKIITDVEYINIENCISSFLSKSNKNNTAYVDKYGNQSTSDNEIAEIILQLLSKNYISNNNINNKNVYNNIYSINQSVFYIPIKVKKFYGDNQVSSFVVEGLIESQEYKNIMTSKLILNIDNTNSTFSIEILKEQDDIDTVTPVKLDSIEENSLNTFVVAQSTDQDIIKEIMKLYKRTILGYQETFYNNYINNNYKNKKFGNFSEFKDYVSKNESLIAQIDIKQYKNISTDNNKVYSIIDQYGNTLIIEYNSVINYKVYFDNYTVELDTFKEDYENTSDEGKILINLGKFKQMLNSKDYNAIYNKLNSTFKQNNFNNVNKLSEYLSENIYSINTISLENYEQNNDYYVCECSLKNQKDESQEKSFTVILKLIDSNNFEMSFSF